MRGRPKIVLARTYQEAMEIYHKYQNNILGVITDVRFPKVERGEKDGLAGIKLCARYVRMIRLFLWLFSLPNLKIRLMQSSMVLALSIRTPRRWTLICAVSSPIIWFWWFYFPQSGYRGGDCPRPEFEGAAKHSFCRTCGIFLISYQQESRVALVLFTCHVPGGWIFETDNLE